MGIRLLILTLLLLGGCQTIPPPHAAPGPVFTMPEKVAWRAMTIREHKLFGTSQLTEYFLRNGKQWRTEVMSFRGNNSVVVCDGEETKTSLSDRTSTSRLNTLQAVQSIYDITKTGRYKGKKTINGRTFHFYKQKEGDVDAEIYIDAKTGVLQHFKAASKIKVTTEYTQIPFPKIPETVLFDTRNLTALIHRDEKQSNPNPNRRYPRYR